MINLAGVDLNLMTAFEALLIEGNVTRAADRIGITQPSMSSALARLRGLFGDPLFVRSDGGMRPTPCAQAAAPDILAALDAMRAALASSRSFDPASADLTIRIATTDYGEFVILPAIRHAALREAPALRIMSLPFDRSTFPRQLDQGQIDLAITVIAPPPPTARWQREPLFTERFVAVARRGHPAIGPQLDLDTFAALDQALVAPGGVAEGPVDRALAGIGRERRIAYSGANFASLLFLLADSDLIACVGERMAQRIAPIIGLEMHPVPLPLDRFTLSMAWSRLSERDPARQWFRGIVRSAIGAQARLPAA